MTTTVELQLGAPEWWTERAKVPEPWAANAWSVQGQQARHHAVARQLDLRQGESLLDFGCGTGEFSQAVPGWVVYRGFDPCQAMIDRARISHRHRQFTTDGTLAEHDHVVAIGPFNLAAGWSRELTWRTLDDLWAITRRTLVVSLLYRVDDPDHLDYHPDDAAEFAVKRTDSWMVDAGYIDNDLLLVLRR